MQIPFTKSYSTGQEIKNIESAMKLGKLSGDGDYTKKCEQFLEDRYSVERVLLTTSCTDALELAALLCDLSPGDEVIVPSFTFVSSALAFVLRGAKIVFCDSKTDHPNMDEDLIESLITSKTKIIVPVHYGGVACNMKKIMEIAKKHNLFVVEDAAQAIESSFNGKQLGTIGDLGTFSFHDTKNISAGEGGALLINNKKFVKRAEILREKGTNRKAFFNGSIDKYGWVDVGSSFLPSELCSAFLYAQLQAIDSIQERRHNVWNYYDLNLNEHSAYKKPLKSKLGNAHLYYLLFKDKNTRNFYLKNLRDAGIGASFHFLPLEKSEYIQKNYLEVEIQNCKLSHSFSEQILRLPLYTGMNSDEIDYVISRIHEISK